ncbi:hypothetical protein TrLO_g513 [Triparma laevis f. longispina]|uniref:Uncharacterized protein n=1 Tax=Triparma laevis f. longispina TaxID=1714387 RepID=A0A9W7KV42_9STRA|nr:hypothetical protein TrLO_g513 [Triparma laevis f. longispina]
MTTRHALTQTDESGSRIDNLSLENAALRRKETYLNETIEKQRNQIKGFQMAMDSNEEEKAGGLMDEVNVRYRYADFVMHELVRRRLMLILVRGFDRWKNLGQTMKHLQQIKREKMKIESGYNLIRSERSAIEKMEENLHSIKMEKACLMLINKHKVTLAKKEIEATKIKAQADKELMTSQLKSMYYQLVQLSDLESQAVDAAKTRGGIHMKNLENTTKRVKTWFDSAAESKTKE